MHKRHLFSLLILPFLLCSAFAEKFEFQYNKGDSYRILSTVNEDVLVNGELHHQAQIINRISVKVTDIKPDGSGIHDAIFMTSENSIGEFNTVYTWGQEYESIFSRSKNGVYTISDEYFMPVVRDVPIFPDRDIKVGESWIAKGHEAHDLRRNFNISRPFKVPFNCDYTYLGTKEINGQKLHVIKAQYQLFYETPAPQNYTTQKTKQDYPVSTRGFSKQILYWDNERGMIQQYSENFRIEIETASGNTMVFKGTANAEVSDIQKVKNEETLNQVKEQIEKLGISNTSVNTDEKGITISIENIQFKADSSELENTELEKLNKIAQILKAFPNNDLLVSGHTARAGSEESCQKLSEERAASVANYIITTGVKDSSHIFMQGFGSKKPVAPNSDEEGMSRNRRVEITILE